MKIEVQQSNKGSYRLKIDGEVIIIYTKQLSDITNKIEAYLKMRYLNEDKENKLSKVMKWLRE